METRKIFEADGKWWMELFDYELEQFQSTPESIRWFGKIPTSEVQLKKRSKP